jgi:type I restriction enzyme M protein
LPTRDDLIGVLPQDEYDRFTRSPKNQHIPKDLLKLFSDIPVDASGDVFGQIYEYFLANFALSEGQGGGEFFTPRSVVTPYQSGHSAQAGGHPAAIACAAPSRRGS